MAANTLGCWWLNDDSQGSVAYMHDVSLTYCLCNQDGELTILAAMLQFIMALW